MLFTHLTLATDPQIPFYADAGFFITMISLPVSVILLIVAIVLVAFAQLKPLHTALLILLAVFVPILGSIVAIVIASVLKRRGQATQAPHQTQAPNQATTQPSRLDAP